MHCNEVSPYVKALRGKRKYGSVVAMGSKGVQLPRQLAPDGEPARKIMFN
jgi:hypothetical protein